MHQATHARANVSRGLTRIYFVFWVLWACYLLWRATTHMTEVAQSWNEVIWTAAFVVIAAGLGPAILLFVIRWVVRGFGRQRVKLAQVWRGQKWGT